VIVRIEYVLLDLFIGGTTLALAMWPRTGFASRMGSALLAVALAIVPFVLWDRAVAQHHWWFDPRYTLGVDMLGLPIEEWGFFLAVPFACVFTWGVFFSRERLPRRLRFAPWIALSLAGSGAATFAHGPGYAGLVLVALGGFVFLDHIAGTALLAERRFWAFAGVVLLLTLVFDGYLTARPVVHYADEHILGFRVLTIPVEDFGYALALVGTSTALFELFEGRAEVPRWLRRVIEVQLGGYRQQIAVVDEHAPEQLDEPRRVAVIGGGLAGIAAAGELGRRGFQVELFEANAFLGGKVGAWTDRLSDGTQGRVEHGFHAFFRHYYNLRVLLDRVGADRALVPIEDYAILSREGRRLGFAGTSTVPLLNLVSLSRAGHYRLRDVLTTRTRTRLEALLRYAPEDLDTERDDQSFAQWADDARLPATLRLLFTTFARAFFAEEDRVSMAELAKSFHFYYLSHDRGLGFDHLRGSAADVLVAPLRADLERSGVRIRTQERVAAIRPDGDDLYLDGERFDHVVLATDIAATRKIMAGSPALALRCPELARRVARLRAGQRYAVLRVWIDRRDRSDLPVFVITERIGMLDAIAYVDRIEPGRALAGSVLELHCYAVPDRVESEDEIRDALLRELAVHRVELAGARVLRYHLQVRADFTAFHTGLSAHRPTTVTEHPRLVLAGDWVRLPCPAMLMEGAVTSGVLAANAVLTHEGLRCSPVFSVPLRGIFAPTCRSPEFR
jgi:isorenieratene synthase